MSTHKIHSTTRTPAVVLKRLVRRCRHPHPYGVMGGALWCPTCGAIMFSTHATPDYMRSEWTVPTHDPRKQPKTVWHNDYVAPNEQAHT